MTEKDKIGMLIGKMIFMRAPAEQVAKAVRYSMVVNDETKSDRDRKQSFLDNDINDLTLLYMDYNFLGMWD